MKFFFFLLLMPSLLLAQDSLLIWQDEFEIDGAPDTSKWGYEVGLLRNEEAQYYTKNRRQNARVENGALVIEALREDWNGAGFTSASLRTKNKASWTYGRIDVKAKFDTERGTWPAIWMLSESQPYGHWPHSGEIDLMENVGFAPNVVHGTIHTEAYNHLLNTHKGASLSIENLNETWNVYSILWSPDSIEFLLNNEKYHSFTKEGSTDRWPFDHSFYLILNMAIGGSWGGQQGIDSTAFPVRMEVDYVRVYKKDWDGLENSFSAEAHPKEAGLIDWSPQKSTYAPLEEIVAHALPQPGWEFSKWSDGNTQNPRKVILDHSMNLTATFIPQGELITQQNFNQGTGMWGFWFDEALLGNSYEIRDSSFCFLINEAGAPWQAQISFAEIPMKEGEKFQLQFSAVAVPSGFNLTVALRMAENPYSPLAEEKSLQISNEESQYTHPFFTTQTFSNGRLEFDAAGNVGEVCISAISLLRLSENSTPNQRFDKGKIPIQKVLEPNLGIFIHKGKDSFSTNGKLLKGSQ